jgi:hypothetical protein
MSIQKQITLRYRSDGHVRFQLPSELCHKQVASILSAKTFEIDGVYRVSVYSSQHKISIRFNETVCGYHQLVQQFSAVISELERNHKLAPEVPNQNPSTQSQIITKRVAEAKWVKWVKAKYDDAKETAQAAKTLTKLGLKKPKALIKDPEKAIIDFLNDVLVLYLIRIHWTRITQEWMPHPWLHRYHWSAVFYLFYLLMRSRRPK